MVSIWYVLFMGVFFLWYVWMFVGPALHKTPSRWVRFLDPKGIRAPNAWVFLYPPPLRRLLLGSYDTYKEIRFNKGPVLKKPTEPTENMWYILCAYIHPVMAHRVLAHTKGGIDFFLYLQIFVKLHQLSKDKVRTGPTPSPPHVSHLWLLHDVIHQTDLSQIRGLRHGSR